MKPLIGISCCNKLFGTSQIPNHAASDYCVRAVVEVADGIPVLLPAIGNCISAHQWLSRLDGILLTGSRSNIAPYHYDGPAHENGTPEDPARDATTLPLIRAAISAGVPILAICRGFQELNVALGGSLHQSLAILPGRLNHAPAQGDESDKRFQKAHSVEFQQTGILCNLGRCREVLVNSLHYQGIDRLADTLRVEAIAPDGTIEAVHRKDDRGFALGLQWHPEFDFATDAISSGIFAQFGRAARSWQQTPLSHQLAAD